MTPTAADRRVLQIAGAIRDAGGRAIIVGGGVRDRLLAEAANDELSSSARATTPCAGDVATAGATQSEIGQSDIAKSDIDVELFGIDEAGAKRVLGEFGRVISVGRAFGVLRVAGLDVDFSLPRMSSAGSEMRGDMTAADPQLDFATAARRRDLTINAMGLDPLTDEILDPLHGQSDLHRRRLRAADPARFAEDPLRGLRAARFAARFEMSADDELIDLCQGLDLSDVAPERIFEEWRKLFQQARKPSLAMRFLADTDLLRAFPELLALVAVPQDPKWHPEGDVWIHTLMVLDVATSLRIGDATDEALMFAALCHDLGKPQTTVREEDGVSIRSIAHERVGVGITEEFLGAMRAPQELIRCVSALVRDHLTPAQYPAQDAGRAAYRRLARRLHDGGASMELLERLARADQWGRTTEDAIARVFPAGDDFLARAAQFMVKQAAPDDAVQGRHLIARGYQPGPEFSKLLKRCREYQDDTGLDDAEAILDELGIVDGATC